MEKEIRQFQFEIRQMDSDTGIVEGYASVFDHLIETWDGSEVVRPGAFAKTLKENAGKVAIFRAHKTDKQIGHGIKAVEDEMGLFVTGKILKDDIQDAREEWALMKQSMEIKRPRGISIGFTTIKEGIIKKFKGILNVRELIELKLWEWSPTPWPANTKAGVTQLRQEENKKMIDEAHFEPCDIEALDNLLNRLTDFNQAACKSTEPDDLVHSLDSTIDRFRRLN